MDVLRRPTNGIADRRFGCGTRYNLAAYLVQTRSQSGYRAVFRPARLGFALVYAADPACRRRPCRVVFPSGYDLVHVP